jgi:hypothetical protein
MLLVDIANINVSKSNIVYCVASNGKKFLIPDAAARPWEEKNYSILQKISKVHSFWVNETDLFIWESTHEKASILDTHGKLFRKKDDILDIYLNNDLKSIYEKGYVDVMIARDCNQSNISALYVTRGENEISNTSLNTIKGLADKLKLKVYKYTDPSGSGIVKTLNDNGGYTKDGVFITYGKSGDLNKVAIYEPS